MNPQLKNPKFYLMILMDISIFIVAICFSYLIRFEFSLTDFYIQQISRLLLWLVPLKFIIFFSLGLYSGMWRYTSVRDFWLLAKACLLSTVLVMVIILTINRFEGFSRSVFVADGIITFILAGGVRMVIRSFYAARLNSMKNDYSPVNTSLTKALIIGAGDAGEKILREIMENNKLHYDVVGFVDDDMEKHGRTIHGIRVLGTVENLPKIIQRKSIQQILIAVPSAKGDQIRHIVDICQKCNTSYKILP